MGCLLIGRGRIVAADLWERDYLDLCGPATLDIRADGTARSHSAPCRPALISLTADPTSLSIGQGSTR
jgi:hypothetical protein